MEDITFVDLVGPAVPASWLNSVNNLANKLSNSYTVATLPTGFAGARTLVTDATATAFASTPTGGGANKVPVYWDGASWKIG